MRFVFLMWCYKQLVQVNFHWMNYFIESLCLSDKWSPPLLLFTSYIPDTRIQLYFVTFWLTQKSFWLWIKLEKKTTSQLRNNDFVLRASLIFVQYNVSLSPFLQMDEYFRLFSASKPFLFIRYMFCFVLYLRII